MTEKPRCRDCQGGAVVVTREDEHARTRFTCVVCRHVWFRNDERPRELARALPPAESLYWSGL